ncbi:MAG: sugar phosphate isomerase/epimerase [Firmicutes bacterium]|nr:sugar phosphate isomerase/epimerase [Bacillota bacterium]
MKISLMSYSLARGSWGQEPDLVALCELAREIGVDGIDWVTVYNFDPKEVAKVTADYGLKNVCYTFFAHIHHADPDIRAEATEKLKRGFEVASILGSDKIMLPLLGMDGQSRELTQELALEKLAEAVSLAEPYKITVTVEHFHGTQAPFITTEDMKKATAAVPGLKVTYDNGNVYTAGEDPAEAFWAIKDHIVHAHFKDWEVVEEGKTRGLDGRCYKPALIGEGVVEPLPCLRAMKKAGYDGYINMEYEGTEYDPKDAIVKGTKYLQALIESLG